MTEFRDKDPVMWKMVEGIVVGVLIIIALVVAVVQILASSIRSWFGGK